MTWKCSMMWWRIRNRKTGNAKFAGKKFGGKKRVGGVTLKAGRNAVEKLHSGMDGDGSSVPGNRYGFSWPGPARLFPANAGTPGACRRLAAALSGSVAEGAGGGPHE